MKVGLNYTLNSQHHTLYDVVACSAVLCCVVWSFMSSHQSFPFESCYWWALWCVQLAYGKIEKLNRTGCDVRLCKYCVLKHPISNFWCCYWTHQVLVRPHFIWMFQWRLLFECSLVKVQATLGWKDIFAWSSLIARFKLSSIESSLGKIYFERERCPSSPQRRNTFRSVTSSPWFSIPSLSAKILPRHSWKRCQPAEAIRLMIISKVISFAWMHWISTGSSGKGFNTLTKTEWWNINGNESEALKLLY